MKKTSVSPDKKVKSMKVGQMEGFSENIEKVREAIAATKYRFESQYQGSILIITRTA
jgi:hypothetical protein